MEFQKMDHLDLPEIISEMDGLQLMLESQKIINKEIYPIVLKNLVSDISPEVNLESYVEVYKEELTKEYLLAIIRECSEALDMINSKPWKQTRFKVDERELKFEFIDIQHFLLSLYDIWKMDRKEVLQYYIAKGKENMRRRENGY